MAETTHTLNMSIKLELPANFGECEHALSILRVVKKRIESLDLTEDTNINVGMGWYPKQRDTGECPDA